MSLTDEFSKYIVQELGDVYRVVLRITKSSNNKDSCLISTCNSSIQYHIMEDEDTKGVFELVESKYKQSRYDDKDELFKYIKDSLKEALDSNQYFNEFKVLYNEIKGYRHELMDRYDLNRSAIEFQVPLDSSGEESIFWAGDGFNFQIKITDFYADICFTVVHPVDHQYINIYMKQLSKDITCDELDLAFEEFRPIFNYYDEMVKHIVYMGNTLTKNLNNVYQDSCSRYIKGD